MTYATCRACSRAFTSGYGAQSPVHPELCRDCDRLGNAAVYGRLGRYDAADVRALRAEAQRNP